MKRLWLLVLGMSLGQVALGQVDVEHRRTLTLQTESALVGQEALTGAGAFWFNENHFPWPDTAMRIWFAGIYVDTELSYFVAGNTNTAVGGGVGGGVYADDVDPYSHGQLLQHQEFDGDLVNGHVFINQTIPNPTPVPLNVSATYAVYKSFYRDASDTRNFHLPPDFVRQKIQGEIRFGGIERDLLSRRGLEVYLAGDANYRSGFEAFGPKDGLFPAHSQYERLFGSVGGKFPIHNTTIFARAAGGLGHDLDELSAWNLGGNLINAEPYTYTIHGYYAREIFAEKFGLVNCSVSQRLTEAHQIAIHFYGDAAQVEDLDVRTGLTHGWHTFIGAGTGVSFRTFWETDVLLSYGYGFNAERHGQLGGHEVGLGLEKKF